MKNRLIKLSLTLLLILGLVGCEGAKQKSPEVSTTGNLSVYYFDVGQGDSILIRTNKGENVLIDGGNNDKGKQVIRYLQALHIDTLDAVIGTHPDADHIGGLDTVIDNMKVHAVYTPKVTHTTITYEDFVKAVKRKGLKLKEAKAGVSLGLSGADAVFVAPVKSYGDDLNAWSAVVKVTYGENSFLFTGDAPVKSEKDMIATGQNIRANVLKVGHHGANTSTSQAFLSAVQPEYAVISAGKGNKYGHPTAEIIKRLQANGSKIYRTDELGTILSTSDGKNIMFTKVPSLASQ